MNTFDRRKFFNRISISAIGALFLSSFPFKFFGFNKHRSNSKVKVRIHPNSVKRNK